AVDVLVEPAWRAGEVGDHEPAVRALVRRLDPGDHTAFRAPGLGGVGELAEAPDLVDLALDPLQRRRLGEGRDASEQDWVAGQAEEVGDAVALAPAHRLRPTVVAVAAHQDVDPGPAPADGADHVAQDERDL